jgi:hypothetical protein
VERKLQRSLMLRIRFARTFSRSSSDAGGGDRMCFSPRLQNSI